VLQRFYFDALQFSRLVDSFDANTLFDVTQSGQHDSVLCLRNVIPAPFLAPRFAASRSTTLFSATLSPWHFYSDTLGLPSNTGWIDVVSPFTAAQLAVRVVSSISTRYQHRDASLAPIVALIAQQFAERSGNYLTFLSSFAYLQQLTALFRQCHPQIPMWEQERNMDEAARARFLQRFAIDGEGVGFAVLGGAFAEGIDLPGNRLIGAFIATLGLPQVNPVNEQIMRRIEAQLGNGYDSTYLFPGLQKVVQAAGRVIRTQSDEGIVVLIDDRFLRAEVRALLPRWWHIGSST
jgi:DNA excision repair protein ERCC-2